MKTTEAWERSLRDTLSMKKYFLNSVRVLHIEANKSVKNHAFFGHLERPEDRPAAGSFGGRTRATRNFDDARTGRASERDGKCAA